MTLREKVASKLSETRAVSPVIGVILMVAITVILAAVIGTFVMGLGNSVGKNAQAGISFTQNNSTGVNVQLTSLGNVDNATNIYTRSCVTGQVSFKSDGDTIKLNCDGVDQVTIIANMSGKENVVATHQIN
ncbi:type IV pilin [Haladaptatus sp. CMAA 1911]|uniref:type IV pilin n=1 Tax=unclassified Haladaptatus TaxID=2622732 RepID=UPI0037541BD6